MVVATPIPATTSTARTINTFFAPKEDTADPPVRLEGPSSLTAPSRASAATTIGLELHKRTLKLGSHNTLNKDECSPSFREAVERLEARTNCLRGHVPDAMSEDIIAQFTEPAVDVSEESVGTFLHTAFRFHADDPIEAMKTCLRDGEMGVVGYLRWCMDVVRRNSELEEIVKLKLNQMSLAITETCICNKPLKATFIF